MRLASERSRVDAGDIGTADKDLLCKVSSSALRCSEHLRADFMRCPRVMEQEVKREGGREWGLRDLEAAERE